LKPAGQLSLIDCIQLYRKTLSINTVFDMLRRVVYPRTPGATARGHERELKCIGATQEEE
jgi:hypothetical protein